MPLSLDLDDAIYDEKATDAEPELPQKDPGAVFCLARAALLALGVALPVLFIGPRSVSLLSTGNGDGWVLLILAVLTAVLVFPARTWVLISGLLAAAFVVHKLVTISDVVEDSTASQLAWGWIPLFINFGLIFWDHLTLPAQRSAAR